METIKHFFSVEGVVFVIAVDRPQLESALKVPYGATFDTDGYLCRFFDYWMKLPKPRNDIYTKILLEKFRLVEDGYFNNEHHLYKMDRFIEMFSFLSSRLEISLRKQEQIFSEINMALRVLKTKEGVTRYVPELVALIAIARHANQEICERYCMQYNSIGHKPSSDFGNWAEDLLAPIWDANQREKLHEIVYGCGFGANYANYLNNDLQRQSEHIKRSFNQYMNYSHDVLRTIGQRSIAGMMYEAFELLPLCS